MEYHENLTLIYSLDALGEVLSQAATICVLHLNAQHSVTLKTVHVAVTEERYVFV